MELGIFGYFEDGKGIEGAYPVPQSTTTAGRRPAIVYNKCV